MEKESSFCARMHQIEEENDRLRHDNDRLKQQNDRLSHAMKEIRTLPLAKLESQQYTEGEPAHLRDMGDGLHHDELWESWVLDDSSKDEELL
jgi:hypothetical protein